MPCIDIHSHNLAWDERNIKIVNILSDFSSIPDSGYFSVGLHPWNLKMEDLDKQFEDLQQALTLSNVVAIGECGLDKACDT
ncbi:MAG: TatD family hydrolase, partial [Bacteroidota bacterium]